MRKLAESFLRAFLVLAFAAGLGTGAYFERVSVPGAASIAVFGWVTITFASRLVTALAGGETVSFESSWGGLGGARGGWRMSAPLGYLAALLVSGLLLVSAVVIETDWIVNASPASGAEDGADSSTIDGAEAGATG